MEKDKIRQAVVDLQELFESSQQDLIERDIPIKQFLKGNEVVIISGIRRCGKSSLLKLISNKIQGKKMYINFDDVRLVNFTIENFQDIEDIGMELYGDEPITYFLDEVQNIPYWERWVNNLYTRDIKVFVTGSNSNLLSSEISTYLTGRNKVIKLFPFSFPEFLKVKRQSGDYSTSKEKAIMFKHFLEYFEIGGFPLIVKNEDIDLSRQYFEDILNKDILIRYKIRESKELKDLILYLFSNVGKRYSYSTLKEITGIKSLSTIKNFIDYFQNVFLLYQVRKFDYSVKKQKVSSSKIYVIDNSFLKTIAFNFSENSGRRLENMVFIELLRRDKEVYYHLEKKECDFVIKEGLKVKQVIQVSLNINNKREIEGIKEALQRHKLDEGLILTFEEENEIKIGEGKIMVKPVWKWLLENEGRV